jgi:hypothetical protein
MVVYNHHVHPSALSPFNHSVLRRPKIKQENRTTSLLSCLVNHAKVCAVPLGTSAGSIGDIRNP